VTTDAWTARLSEYLDDELPAFERAACEAHLAACAECRTTLEELRRVVARARSLDERPPATDLWSGIAARIGTTPAHGVPAAPRPEPDVVPLAPRRAARARHFTLSLPQLAAAGIALAVVSGGAVALALHDHGAGAASVVATDRPAIAATTPTAPTPAADSGRDSRAPATPSAPSAGRPSDAQLATTGSDTARDTGIRRTPAAAIRPPRATTEPRAELAATAPAAGYSDAVEDLERVLEAGRGRLDPATVKVLERNLATIDSAIAEAQRAVAADPKDPYLSSYLARTMRRKIQLLRTAAVLASQQS
jgi:Putative zinc-finger